ncbi:ribonuclease BN [Pseudonocardia sp. N23]|nr:ribonuclease BN [Pseudonocardia sp. N23]
MPILAGGVAFFAFLALFPAMIAAPTLYGLVADPAQVAAQVQSLAAALPESARPIITDQLDSITSTGNGALGIGLVVSLLAAFWSASTGTMNLIRATNLAYDEDERERWPGDRTDVVAVPDQLHRPARGGDQRGERTSDRARHDPGSGRTVGVARCRGGGHGGGRTCEPLTRVSDVEDTRQWSPRCRGASPPSGSSLVGDGRVDADLDRGEPPDEVLRGDAVDVEQPDAVGADGEGAEIGVDAFDAGQAGERVGALRHQFRSTLLVEQGHHDPDATGPDGEIHGTADGRDGLGRAGVPVGEVAAGGDLEGAEDADVEVSAPHHREGVGLVEVGRPGELGDRDLAGVDQVRVDVVAVCGGAHVEHAVLGVQDDSGARREMVGDQRGLADAEVDVGPVGVFGGDVAGDGGGDVVLAPAVGSVVGAHAALSCVAATMRST